MQLTIVAGITGFDKSAFLCNLIGKSLELQGLPDDPNSASAAKFIKCVKFEDELLQVDEAMDMPTFLNKNSLKQKTDAIEKTFTRIGKQLKENIAENVILDIHLSYLRNSEFTSPLFLSGFRELVQDDTPIKVITLIDDIYIIHHNVRKREDDFPNTKLRLREILSWRSVEILQAESLARNYTHEHRNVKNYLVSVRHPFETFSNLIFKKNPKTAYMSYPISKTRTSKDSVADINKARKDLHKVFADNGAVLLDPVTIDELVLKFATIRESDQIVLNADSRWPIEHNGLAKPVDWPITIPEEEIKEVKSDIDNQVSTRDFKLIDNALLFLSTICCSQSRFVFYALSFPFTFSA